MFHICRAAMLMPLEPLLMLPLRRRFDIDERPRYACAAPPC